MLLFDFSNDDQQATRYGDARGRYDRGLIVAATLLASLGVVMVASSSIAVADGQHIGAFYFLYRHLVFLAFGLIAALVMARIELAWLERHALPLLLCGTVLLLLVFLLPPPFLGGCPLFSTRLAASLSILPKKFSND